MTEKKVWTLKVDEEFKALIPPLTDEEHRMLEDSILRDGCDTPLTVWDGTIVDGHNRYDICVRHSIPFAYEERQFEDRDAAVFWMLEHQLARRNLNSYQRSLLALRFEPMLKKVAKGKQGKRNDLDANFQLNLAGSSNGYSAEKMAELAGVSLATIKKVKRLEKAADEETKKQLRKGDTSIHKAYTEIMNKEHEGETRVCERYQQAKPFSEFRLPSNRKNVRPICKECEAKAKQAAKEAEIAASLPVPPEISGIGIKDGQTAHISLGLPDDPAMFEQMIALLQHAQDAYIAAFKSTIAQYGSVDYSALEGIDYTAPENPVVRLGDRVLYNYTEGDDVKELQQSLISLGFDCGSYGADGEYGDCTEMAVTSFQKAHGLSASGKYDAATHAALTAALAAQPGDTEAHKAKYVEIQKNKQCYIRTQPNTDGDKLGIAHSGDRLPYLGTTYDNGWFSVQYKDREACVSGKYARLTE